MWPAHGFLPTVCIKNLDKLNLVKIRNGGLVLGLSQFLLQPQLSQKMILDSKVVESDSKIITSVCLSKSVTHSVAITKPGGFDIS